MPAADSPPTSAPPRAGNRASAAIKFALLASVLLVTVSLVVHLLPDGASDAESAAESATRAGTRTSASDSLASHASARLRGVRGAAPPEKMLSHASARPEGGAGGNFPPDTMERPILTRTDAQGRLFTVSAASATRTCAENSALPHADCRRQDAVSLQEVRADTAFDSPFQEDDRLFLSAASALLRADTEHLELFAPMNIVTTSNYRMQAEWLGVDLKQSRIEEGRAISLEGPAASLRAQTMSTSPDGNMLTFRGNVRLRWH